MVTSVVAEIKEELASIEKLISSLLQKQVDIVAKLASLEEKGLPDPSTAGVLSGSIPGPSTWSTVTAGKIRRSPPPVLTSSEGVCHDLELYNSFAPLADLPMSPSNVVPGLPDNPGPERRPPPASTPGYPTSSTVKGKGGRKATSKRNRSPSDDHPTPDKRPRVSSSSSEWSLDAMDAPADRSPPPGHGVVSSGNVSPSVCPSLPSYSVSSTAECRVANNNNATNPDSCLWLLKLPPKTTIHYDCHVQCKPEILIVGDSIVRQLIIPGAITVSLSGGRVSDISKLIPSLLDWHPSVNTVIVHVGTNDVMARSSIKLQTELESLCLAIERLGKRCVMSGPIPLISWKHERFSRLYSLHNFLKNLCYATGQGFISNFDIFWTNAKLYRSDGLHPNKKGTQELTKNVIHFIASL